MKRALIIAITMALAYYANAAFNCPVYRQGDSRWGNNQLGFGSYTIARKGCFLTCQTAMIASQGIKVNGQTPDPGNMNSWFKANDEFQGGNVLYKAPEKFGFTYDGKMTSKSDILNAFNEGKFVFLHVENLSHWVVVTDYDSNGYKIMDPAGVKTSYPYSAVPEVAVYTAPAGSPGTSSSSSSSSSPSESTTPSTTTTQPTQTTPSSPQQQDNSQQDSSLVSESLTAHNEWRAAVGVPDLAWDATLAASAQAWADHIASTGSVSHSSNRNNIGENIAYGTTSTNTVTDFVDLWGAESKYFVAGKPYPQCTRGSEADVWHYTQLVWKATTQVGCGMGQSNGKSYYVCQYYPRGNMRGQSVF